MEICKGEIKMHYYVVNMSNGLCGCDEDFIIKSESELTWDDFVEKYTYRYGVYDMDDYDEDEYLEDINDYSSYEEISKEKFDSLKNKYEEVKW